MVEHRLYRLCVLIESSKNPKEDYKVIACNLPYRPIVDLLVKPEHVADERLYSSARLLLSLYELRREPKMRQAREWFLSSFRPDSVSDFPRICPPGSDQETFFRMVYSYWEMASSFVTAGIVDENLFVHNNSELLQVWERIRVLVPRWRVAWKNPLIVKHMEEVAQKAVDYLNRANPEAHATFVAKMR